VLAEVLLSFRGLMDYLAGLKMKTSYQERWVLTT